MNLGLTVDSKARPLATEIWPGNTADVTALILVADRLRERFAMPELCVVADRGMISKATGEKLRERLLKAPKALVGNRGFERYLEADGQSFTLDEDRIADEERYDGVWALRVTGPLTAGEPAIREHLFCSFLATVLRQRM